MHDDVTNRCAANMNIKQQHNTTITQYSRAAITLNRVKVIPRLFGPVCDICMDLRW